MAAAIPYPVTAGKSAIRSGLEMMNGLLKNRNQWELINLAFKLF